MPSTDILIKVYNTNIGHILEKMEKIIAKTDNLIWLALIVSLKDIWGDSLPYVGLDYFPFLFQFDCCDWPIYVATVG